MKPALVLLAAGASRRLGECKALVDLAGSTPLERLLTAGAACDDGPALVLTGAAHDELRAALSAPVEVLRNAAWEEGRTGSVLAAHKARPGRDLCLAPVDVPLVPGRVFELLVAHWMAAGQPPRGWLAPCYRGRHGHPVVLGRELLGDLEEALAHDPELSLRDLRQTADPLLSLESEAPEILDDLDLPTDLARLRARCQSR